ncbi:activator of Hsp90 ATPase [Gymnopilus junonius]|uniref:Activator of Hsp90 ATPase n=1 Tax=Gymnopilus junonius TaxID=109634 RepID=A0A9P5TSX5_GYMJU|nr:activator of Hsp90 ATPase [Gymnopilus junonius]
MALPPTTANWHWKNKMSPTGGEIGLNGDNEGEVVSISQVTEVDGDIELGQRKSKLITIFDTKVTMKWQGTTSSGTEVQGNLTIPEVSHEVICDGLSEFVYNWTLVTPASPEVNAVFDLARSRLPTALEAKLATFPIAMLETHGRDLTVSAEPSRATTPSQASKPTQSAAAAAAAAAPVAATSASFAPVKSKAEQKGHVNTTTVVVEADFRASAEDLFNLLTDEKRIPSWTRAPAKSKAEAGSDYSLFGGGTWALRSPTWPTGHEAALTTTLEQGDESTKVTFHLAGIPLGMEEEIKKNLEGYYVHGFKSIGYAYLIPTAPVYSSSYIQNQSKLAAAGTKATRSDNLDVSFSSYFSAVAIAVLVLATAFTIPLLSSAGFLR